jgi:hypothetical protein
MLRNNTIPYEDEYVYFTFNNIHSSEYNLYIQNNFEDLKILLNTGASIEYASPKYKNGNYVLGVTHSQREIPLKLVAENLTRAEVLKMTKWLKAGTIGELIFDFASDWTYDTIIEKISDPNLYEQDDDTFVVSFDVTWKTIESTMQHTTVVSGFYGRPIENITVSALINTTNEALEVDEDNIVCTSNGFPLLQIIKKEDGSFIARIFHLGDGYTDFQVQHNYNAFENNGQKQLLTKLDLSLTNEHEYSPIVTSLQAELTNSNGEADHVVQYSTITNTFFTDNWLPEQQNMRSHFKPDTLKVAYGTTPLQLFSPGAPTVVTNNEHLAELAGTLENWCVIRLKPTLNEVGYAPSGISDYPYITKTPDIEYAKDIDYANKDYSNMLFVYYDEIQIQDDSLTGIATPMPFIGFISAKQFTEAI